MSYTLDSRHVQRSHRSNARIPGLSYPLDLFDEAGARNLQRACAFGILRIVVVWNVEWIPKKPDIGCLECLKRLYITSVKVCSIWSSSPYWSKITVSQPQANRDFCALCRRTLHVDDNDKLYSCVCYPAVHGDSFVECVEQAEIMCQALGRHTGFEYVET